MIMIMIKQAQGTAVHSTQAYSRTSMFLAGFGGKTMFLKWAYLNLLRSLALQLQLVFPVTNKSFSSSSLVFQVYRGFCPSLRHFRVCIGWTKKKLQKLRKNAQKNEDNLKDSKKFGTCPTTLWFVCFFAKKNTFLILVYMAFIFLCIFSSLLWNTLYGLTF